MSNELKRLSVEDILNKKKNGQKITVLTAYDYPLASIIDKAGIDIILVGDSLANVVLGLEFTREIGMEEMLHHSKAVNRGVQRAMLIGDMPYGSYHHGPAKAVKNARRFLDEAGCNAVKIEWFPKCLSVAKAIVEAGIPLMGHVGLTPQAIKRLEDFKVQGKEAAAARKIIQNAKNLEAAGCFSIVLECIPDRIAEIITQELGIPTIGIGAGGNCDGQVLVSYDLLGLFDRHHPRFVKEYIDLKYMIFKAVTRYREDVLEGKFPAREHAFSIKEEEYRKLMAKERKL